MKIFLFCIVAGIALTGCKTSDTPAAHLQETLSQLNGIQSAAYYETTHSWEPGDTIPTATGFHFIREFDNPADTTIGAIFLKSDGKDTSRTDYYYDGKARYLIYHDAKGIMIDDFTVRRLPFRLVPPPFFNYAKSIIHYILTTKDSITTQWKDLGDEYHLKLVIHTGEQVEFFGKPHYIAANPYITQDPTSVYELWIGKADGLPYKIRREMFHNISSAAISGIQLNTLSLGNFDAAAYLPQDYEIRKYGQTGSPATPKEKLLGEKAPHWSLNDADGRQTNLNDLKNKVVLINFTGIECGACRLAIPFLNELKQHYKPEDFSVVAIECWGRTPHSLRNYINKNAIRYPFLEGKEEAIDAYIGKNRGVPVFYLLDKQQIIRKIFHGYSAETTAPEIRQAIENLL